MAYVAKNQDGNILDEIVVSKFENLPLLLEIIAKNPQITQSALKKKSKFSSGKIYHCVRAMKTMKLVENGNGLKITDLGRVLLMSHSNKEEFKKGLKIACLNIPLFSKLYQNNKDITDPRKLFELLEREISGKYENIDSKFIGAVVRRYLQGIYDIKLRVGFKLHPEEDKANSEKKISFKKDDKEIIDTLKNLKRNLNLSDKEFNTLINSLPEKKRDEIFSQILSKVFK